MYRRTRSKKEPETLNIYPAFTDLMSNAFMILSLFLLLALLQSQELNRKLRNAKPIIIDEKSGNFKFQSGSAELNFELKNYIRTDVISKIENTIKEKEGGIDFIQVIGHTDGQPTNKQANNEKSNLDDKIELVAKNKNSINSLSPGSNTDLGLMRALAVIQEIQKTKRLKNIKFRAYSAGQLYLSSGDLAPVNRKADEKRRRIEIRFIPRGEKQ
jgi:hypothetical protein